MSSDKILSKEDIEIQCMQCDYDINAWNNQILQCKKKIKEFEKNIRIQRDCIKDLEGNVFLKMQEKEKLESQG